MLPPKGSINVDMIKAMEEIQRRNPWASPQQVIEMAKNQVGTGAAGSSLNISGAPSPTPSAEYNPFTDPNLSDEEYERMMRSGLTNVRPMSFPDDTGTDPGAGRYNSVGEIVSDMERGAISEEEGAMLVDQFNQQGYASKTTGGTNPNAFVDDKGRLVGGSSIEGEESPWAQALRNPAYFSPSLSLESTLHHMGRAIGAPKGTKGRGLQIGLTAADSLLKGTRTVLSGVGYSKVNREMQEWMRDQLARRDYTPDPQYDDVNYTGGFTFAKYGGMRKYPDGGTPPSMPSGLQTVLNSYKKNASYKLTPDDIWNALIEERGNISFRLKSPNMTKGESDMNMQDLKAFDQIMANRYPDRASQYFQAKREGLGQFSSGLPIKKYGGKMRKYPNGGEQGEQEVQQDPEIHSIFDPRYKEFKSLQNRQRALEEYKKWHQEVEAAAPQTHDEFMNLMHKSDSLAYASRYLPYLPASERPVLWTNPTTGRAVHKKRDMTPVENPYSLDVPATPWGEDKAQGDAFRKWVNETHPDLAEQWDIDMTGNPDNLYVRSAYYELADEYEASKAPKPKTPVKQRIEEEQKEEARMAYKSQTVMNPDGSWTLRQVPYYNYDTRENLDTAGVVFTDQQGNEISSERYYQLYPDQRRQKYGGLFEYNNGGQFPGGGFSDLTSQAFNLLDLGLQAQGTLNPNNTMAGNDAGMTDFSNPNTPVPGGMDSSFQVGQPVTFEYGGKMVSGTIKKIENGKIYV